MPTTSGCSGTSPVVKTRATAASPRSVSGVREVQKVRNLPPYARRPVWPAYLVAAVCFVLVVVTASNNLALTSENRQLQSQVARGTRRTSMLSRTLALERTALADLENPQARHYSSGDGQVIESNGRLYVLMQGLAMPPHGRVYQAWTVPRGSTAMVPSVRFIPDAHGVAIVALGEVEASHTSTVAVSVEPDAGSKAPTSPLLLDVGLE